MAFTFAEFSEQWSSLHGDTPIKGFVRGWLKISFRAAQVAALLRISAHSLTAIGLLGAIATALTAPHWYSLFFLALSIFADGIDGSVAILSGKSSQMGAFLDSFSDRISEFFWAIALFRVGTPLAWVMALTFFAALQEYARARLTALGIQAVGVITPAERPVRAIFLALAILVSQVSGWSYGVKALAASLTILQLYSFLLLLRYARNELTRGQPE